VDIEAHASRDYSSLWRQNNLKVDIKVWQSLPLNLTLRLLKQICAWYVDEIGEPFVSGEVISDWIFLMAKQINAWELGLIVEGLVSLTYRTFNLHSMRMHPSLFFQYTKP
jgi:hypothetical protein